MTQPINATQLSRRTKSSRDSCSHVLNELLIYELVACLNPAARCSRLYWLTSLGHRCREKLCPKSSIPKPIPNLTKAEWILYGAVCFSHRSAVIKTLHKPLQSAKIKRIATFLIPDLKLSANNVREVVQFLKTGGIVNTVYISGKAHPRYRLTKLGEQLKTLLLMADSGVVR